MVTVASTLALLRLGHEEHEITAAFTRFDQDGDHVLDQEEQEQMRRGLEEERVSGTGWRGRSIYTSPACPPSHHTQAKSKLNVLPQVSKKELALKEWFSNCHILNIQESL